MITKTEYQGFPSCIELSNGAARLIVSTDFGPRILLYALDGSENILGWHPEAAVNTALGTWKPYGGHRLWRAPENMPLSYAPDNESVKYETDGELSILLTPQPDAAEMQKVMRITLSEKESGVTIDHRITNFGDAPVDISAWALTIMRPGGEAIIPNEPFKPYGPDNLLPVRSMTVWSYTDFTDPRWSFEKEFIRLRVDENVPSQQKLGVLNRRGWAAYKWQDLIFVKRFDVAENMQYPDMNSNNEVYTDGGFVELETISPLKKLATGEAVEYQERWELKADGQFPE